MALSLAFPPAEVWPLSFFAPIPLLWAIRRHGSGSRFLAGLAFGVGAYGAVLYWILRFGLLAWIALTLVCALSTALFALLAPLVRPHGRPLLSAVGSAALWTLVDRLRGSFPFGGFNWGNLGVSQVDDRVLARLATLTGVVGVTFVVVLVAALLEAALWGRGAARSRLGRVGLAAVAVLAPAVVPFSQPNGGPLEVAIIQVDVRVPPGTSDAAQDRIVAARHVALSARLAGQGPPPDLMLWGEGALDPAAIADDLVMREVSAAVAQVGAPTVIGAVLNDPDGTQHTSVLAFDALGRADGRYDKVQLVPYGEYVPFRDRLGFIHELEQIPVDRTPGERVHAIAPGGLPAFGTPICYENSFPEIPRAMVQDGATFLVVPVNNSSYGFTAASDQHLQMSRMRAIETGRWVVNAAISGVSAFIAPDGTVIVRTGLYEDAILRRVITTSTARTPYVRFGDWFIWLSAVVVGAIAIVPRRRRSSRPAPEPMTGTPRVLVVLPTYDEAATIEEVIRRTLGRPERVDVLVIDDSSPDGTAEVVTRIAEGEPRVRLRERPPRSGLASAYREGFRVALDEGYDVAVEMDSDLSHDPDELSDILTAVRSADLVIGSRYVPGGSVTNWSAARVALSKSGNRYARLMLGIPVRDATSGYRAYRRELLSALMSHPMATEGYGFQIEMVSRAYHLGFHLLETPITFREREHGVSKISRRIVAEALWQVTLWGAGLRLGWRPR